MTLPAAHLRDILDCAVTAVHAAGRHALRNARRRNEVIKTFRHDVKLRLDVECQEKAEAAIRAKFPAHAVLGEENIGSRRRCAASVYQWIIDPIDGTVNFSHGLPVWCCSIACRRGDEILAAAVYAPALDRLYTATAREPSLCNGTPIRVSTTGTLAASIVLTGLDKEIDPSIPPLTIFKQIALNTQKARIMGSAALDICLVAAGQADGYFEAGIYIWDIAAAGLVVRQAGGKAEILGRLNNNRLRFLASNGLIHDDLKRLVKT